MPRAFSWTAKEIIRSSGQKRRTCFFDLGSGVGIDDDDDALEAGGEGVRGDEVDHGLTVHANGRELLETAVTSCAACGEDDE